MPHAQTNPATAITADKTPTGGWRALARTVLWWPFLFVLLILSSVLGPVASLATLILALFMAFVTAPQAWADALREPFAVLFLVGFALMAVTTAVTSGQPQQALNIFNFLPMVLALPVFAAARAMAGGNMRAVIAWMCLAGVILALAAGVFDIYMLGKQRSSGFLNNSIVYGRTSAVLGFFALSGYFLTKAPTRYVFLLGPLLGTIALVLSGTRGGMLALPAAFLISFLAILFTVKQRLKVVLVGSLALLALVVSAYFIQAETHGRGENLLEVIPSVLSGNGDIDRSTSTRLRMYETGFAAFKDAPFLGHGWANLIEAASRYMPEDEANRILRPQNHLHNDFINFAVASGIPGIVAFLLFLAAPLVQIAVRRSAYETYHVPLYYFSSLVAIYFVAGLFDITLGYDVSTTVYALTIALVAGLYLRPADKREKSRT